MGNEVLEMRMSVADFAQPLLSVGQMVSAGNRVILSPEMSCGKQKWKDWNGVYVVPLWLDSEKMADRSL